MSDKRNITREILPTAIKYPFEKDYNKENVEICYARKCWGMRTSLINEVHWSEIVDDWKYVADKPAQIIEMIEVVASWLDEERWEDEGSSIWTYQEAQHNLINWIINLALIINFLENNPDCYLEFYDSY